MKHKENLLFVSRLGIYILLFTVPIFLNAETQGPMVSFHFDLQTNKQSRFSVSKKFTVTSNGQEIASNLLTYILKHSIYSDEGQLAVYSEIKNFTVYDYVQQRFSTSKGGFVPSYLNELTPFLEADFRISGEETRLLADEGAARKLFLTLWESLDGSSDLKFNESESEELNRRLEAANEGYWRRMVGFLGSRDFEIGKKYILLAGDGSRSHEILPLLGMAESSDRIFSVTDLGISGMYRLDYNSKGRLAGGGATFVIDVIEISNTELNISKMQESGRIKFVTASGDAIVETFEYEYTRM